MRVVLVPLLLLAACRTPATRAVESALAGSVDCASGGDDTPAVQTAMTAGTCLGPGTYRVDAPALGPTGRRRDAMLVGGTLCGVRSAETTVLFRGDARGLLWVGVQDADVHDVRLDSTCLTGTVEQTHLVKMTAGHVVHDAVLAHPPRATAAGDAVNVVGSLAAPMTGMAVDHVTFESCARFGVQISRGVSGGRITDSTFGGDCAFGSEGGGGIDGLLISHDTFASGARGLALDVQRQTNLRVSHVDVRGRTILLFHCDGCLLEHVTVSDIDPGTVGDYATAVTVADVAHDVTLSDVHLTQSTTQPAPVIHVGPLRPDRQADLARVRIDNCVLVQRTSAVPVTAFGVAGLTLSSSSVTYAGPAPAPEAPVLAAPSVAVPPATSVPTTDVAEPDVTLAGFPVGVVSTTTRR